MAKKKPAFENIIEETPLIEEEKKTKKQAKETEEVTEINDSEEDLLNNINEETTKIQKEEKEDKPRRVTVAKGLTYEEVKEREEQGLVNKAVNKNTRSIKSIVLSNIFTVFNILNIIIAVALIIAEEYKNILFLPIVIINTIIGIVQEIKAKKTIDRLSLISAPTVYVIRNGHKETISSDQLVIDDIVYFDSGKQIVADCVVRKGTVEVNESLLTGESDNIVKKPGSLLYSGSYIVSGDCYAKVERVGNQNYINQLANSVKKYSKPKSEIMNALSIFIRVITIVVIVLGTLLFTTKFLSGVDWKLAVKYAASSMIGMIPSGLFLMTSISLAFGVIKLGKHNTLVQDLYCIEMLARVDCLCLDKTGTITDGTMKVRDIIDYNVERPLTIKQTVAFILGNCKENNATAVALDKKFGHVKKATSKAIVPFSSVRKLMAAYDEDTKLSYIIGAPEYILGDSYPTSTIALEVESYARQGLRVLLLASSPTKISSVDQDFASITPLCLITIEDVIRKNAVETIQYFKDSNVMVKVISGDNPLTVSKIAQRAGVDNASRCISLEGMSDDEVERVALKYTVFGRVSPKQKQIIIKTLKSKGHTVAMTGDGVNDILALKEADCGIAMANGSEAARDVSHLVLLDSDFSSMPYVVSEGRRVINNIKRVASMYLTKTLFSFLLTITCLIFKLSYPIEPIQLMLYDWFVVTIPSFYLALESNNNQIKGNFMKDVLLNALPGAILILINFAAIQLVSQVQPELFFVAGLDSDAVISTLTVLTTTIVGFVVLFKQCKPFNKGRASVYVVMLFLFSMCLSSLAVTFNLLSFKELGLTSTLLFLVIVLCSIFIYKFFIKLIDFVKNRTWEKYIK